MNTLNEEPRIGTALRSVHGWVDDIVVVDMHSDDRTVEIAREFGARVFMHERLGYADPARAFAIGQAVGDWVLVLDADELVPPALAERLREVVADDSADVVDIPMVNYLLGRPMRHTGWGPAQDHHARFFKRNAVAATGRVHDYLEIAPEARVLRLPPNARSSLIHFNYVDIAQFIEKTNRYTSVEARDYLRSHPRPSRRRAITAAVREFGRRYVGRRGFRDGWRGFYLAGLMAFYRFIVHAKARELAENGSAADVESGYRRIAEMWLAGKVDATLRQ